MLAYEVAALCLPTIFGEFEMFRAEIFSIPGVVCWLAALNLF
jgi:hypothetical protein